MDIVLILSYLVISRDLVRSAYEQRYTTYQYSYLQPTLPFLMLQCFADSIFAKKTHVALTSSYSLGSVVPMDVYFYLQNVTDDPLYNCSALTEKKLMSMRGLRQPKRGMVCLIFGISMILIYIACLRVMVKLSLIRNSCYKIMFVLGHFEMISVFMNDILAGYIFFTGLAFCEAPNIIYILGCLHVMTWAAATYLCLYLAFNRVLEILEYRRMIDFFFSPTGTFFGILFGIMYSTLYLLFATPAIFSNEADYVLPNPLGLDIPPEEMRNGWILANNYGVVSATCLLYGFFFLTIRKKFRGAGNSERPNRLRSQVFMQSVLLCSLNFCLTSVYTIFAILKPTEAVMRVAYPMYQFSTALQAIIYLLFNQTILNGVKEDLFSLLRIKQEKAETDIKTNITTTTHN